MKLKRTRKYVVCLDRSVDGVRFRKQYTVYSLRAAKDMAKLFAKVNIWNDWEENAFAGHIAIKVMLWYRSMWRAPSYWYVTRVIRIT